MGYNTSNPDRNVFTRIRRISVNYDIAIKGMALLALLSVPFGFVHELGHTIPCINEGSDYNLKFSFFRLFLICEQEIESVAVFKMMGGVFAGSVAMIPFLAIPRTTMRYPWIAIAVISIASAHFVTVLIETVWYETYIQTPVSSIYVTNGVMIGAFVLSVTLFSKLGSKNKSD